MEHTKSGVIVRNVSAQYRFIILAHERIVYFKIYVFLRGKISQ